MTNRKVPEIVGKPLRYNLGTMAAYSHSVNDLLNPMMAEMEEMATTAFKNKNIFSQEALLATLQHNLIDAEATQLKIFEDSSQLLFIPYINAIDRDSTTAISRNVRKFYNDPIVLTNTSTEPLIKEASDDDFSAFMTGLVMFYFLKHRKKLASYVLRDSASSLQQYLSSQRRITRKRAKFELQDNYRETFNALNKAKMEANGLSKFKWIYTFRSKTERPYHVNVLRDQVFSISSPPIIDPKTRERGFPGQLYNCKCVMLPILELS